MQDAKIVAYCSSCEAPIVAGMKLNTYPCSEHADCYEVYCQSCVDAAMARLGIDETPGKN